MRTLLWIIYIIGCIVSFYLLIDEYSDPDGNVSFGDFLNSIILSLTSWLWLLIVFGAIDKLIDKIEEIHFKLPWKKKERH